MSFKKKDMEKIEKAAEIFKGFGNPLRIRIIDALREDNMRVMELAEKLGLLQPIVSQQLKILKNAGIVQKIKKKQSFKYGLTDPHFSDMIKCMRGCLGI